MLYQQEQRYAYYDKDLDIEAYRLSGIVQKFPNHFHDYYVVGFIEGGRRHLRCRGKEYQLSGGDLVLFNPKDSHQCAPVNGETLEYRALNITEKRMRQAAADITGRDFVPHFGENTVPRCDITAQIGTLYRAIVEEWPKMEKEELFYLLIEQLLAEFAQYREDRVPAGPSEVIRTLCQYIEDNYSQAITLDELADLSDLSKSYLVRSFTRQVGVSPHRYLQSVRIQKAKKMLEQGASPIEAAGQAGFSDQSHFTNSFKGFIGLTPKQYQNIFSKDDRTGGQ
ncbi:AraC family transcriptional regulator [Anaerovorax odorimutans]|uniref:AraC family transcriptional regulator n=1 Tax=Anaerovorax odorimutans TaxID=109327 RepID=A0ABT1RQA7_9FIRM|nr:AraC family transcriptional regulator [Anaerovorax odorimutans]MCQ4637383.1 AraC family transcriptional regulator [Anaerovorax odorimutans]